MVYLCRLPHQFSDRITRKHTFGNCLVSSENRSQEFISNLSGFIGHSRPGVCVLDPGIQVAPSGCKRHFWCVSNLVYAVLPRCSLHPCSFSGESRHLPLPIAGQLAALSISFPSVFISAFGFFTSGIFACVYVRAN